MKPISRLIDETITRIENIMIDSDKHVIKTESIKARVSAKTKIHGINENSTYLAGIGLGQVIQSRLNERGYRSVRCGMFVNIDNCDDIDYLNKIVENADQTAETRSRARARIKALRDKKLTGQLEFDIHGNVINGIRDTMTEEELLEKLEADAV